MSPYTLLPRTNRGQPLIKYEPTLNCKVKYPINNYVSSEKLSKSYVNFVSQLSIAFTPSSLQEALADSKWIQAMKTKMQALEKNTTWKLVRAHYRVRIWGRKDIALYISGIIVLCINNRMKRSKSFR